MRHFAYLRDSDAQRLFSRLPATFTRSSDPAVLATALGATLYCPATRPCLTRDLARRSAEGVRSMVLCLEDAIPDAEVAAAEANLIAQLRECSRIGAEQPLVFVRVRRPDQIHTVARGLADCTDVLSGFVLPKFGKDSGAEYLDAVVTASGLVGRRLFAMPVIESAEVIYRESRLEALLGIWSLLDKYRKHVLAVRVGTTDLCGLYGLRRDRDLTIYDVRVAAEVLADVVNVLGRADGSGHVISGPVWEYFNSNERLFKPQLRISPFEHLHASSLRQQLILRDLDGLIREVVLDKANGFLGKTVIHPSHVAAVHALSVVTHEEYSDAADLLDPGEARSGVSASSYRNKMNESKPHRSWAERTMRRAEVFGVAAAGINFVDLLSARAVA
jgi:citrate lyase beta subunit